MQFERLGQVPGIYCPATSEPEHIAEVFNRYGVAVIKDFYRADREFEKYVQDLKWCVGTLLNKRSIMPDPSWTLEQQISRLFELEPTAPMPVYHLGTQPNKMVSGNLLKFSPRNLAIVYAILGSRAVLAEPAAGDTLIGFPPGEQFDRYLLPIHQDFPYLLQSARQLTFWLSLSNNIPNVGGIDVFVGSHRLGPHPIVKDSHGHYEASLDPSVLASFPRISVDWEYGDLIVMSSHLLHQGKPNRTSHHTRIIQLFRYSDLNEPVAISYDWTSKTYMRPSSDSEPVIDLYRRSRINDSAAVTETRGVLVQ